MKIIRYSDNNNYNYITYLGTTKFHASCSFYQLIVKTAILCFYSNTTFILNKQTSLTNRKIKFLLHKSQSLTLFGQVYGLQLSDTAKKSDSSTMPKHYSKKITNVFSLQIEPYNMLKDLRVKTITNYLILHTFL